LNSSTEISKFRFPFEPWGKLIIFFAAAFMILSPFFYSFSTDTLLEPNGENVAADFGAFYIAGSMARDGDPVEAYDWRKLTEKFDAYFGFKSNGMTFNYPPPVLFPLMAISKIPYRMAAFLWMVGGLLAFAVMLRKMGLPFSMIILALAIPGVAKNLTSGQIDLYLVAALGAGLVVLDSRPLLAGMLFALAALKPQLAVLVPIALLCGRHWQTLAASAVCFIVLNGIAALWFDLSIWPAVFHSIETSSALLDAGNFKTYRMPSLFIYMLNSGLDIPLARIVHLIVAISMILLIGWVWWKKRGDADGGAPGVSLAIKSSILIAATPLVSPYIYDYDLVLLILPIVWICQMAGRRGWKQNEQWLLLVTILVAWLPTTWTEILGFQPGVGAVLILLYLSLRRHRQYETSAE